MAKNVSVSVLDSWEDLEDNQILDLKLKEIKNQKECDSDRPSGSGSVSVPKLHDVTGGTKYQAQMKILKRETGGNAKDGASKSAQQKKPLKSLEQREAEYAEARLRIMGLADSETNDQSAEKPKSLRTATGNLTILNNVVRQPKGPDGSAGFNMCR